jgi:pimeloyl-ACP methyl ester carboxylesterase
VRTFLVVLVLALTAVAAPVADAATPTAITAPTKVVKIGKQKVGYRTFGTGRPLVMVMGLGGTMGSWDPTFLDALAGGGHRIVLLDNEGVGRTTRLKGQLTIRRMAETTAGLIKRLKLKRPDVAGWSMGGMIAQSLVVRHPKLVRRLVLMATAPGDGKATPPTPAALQVSPSDANAIVGLLFPADQTPARDTYIKDILMRRPFEGVAPPAQSQRQLSASGAWLVGQDRDGKRVAKLKLPTLIGGGEQDQLLPVPNQRHLHDIIKGSKLVTYPDASHGFLFQHQADWVPLMLGFLT